MNFTDINTSYWQLSVEGLGLAVTGNDDINQCIINIVTTIKGSDPFRPDFGCDILLQQDKPLNNVIPTMIANIVESIGLYEPRITLTSVTHEIDSPAVKFFIAWKLKEGVEAGIAQVDLNLFSQFSGSEVGSRQLLTDQGIAISDDEDRIILAD